MFQRRAGNAVTTYYPDLMKHSFFRPADWRWRRACRLAERGRSFARRRDDDETGRAVRYLRALGRGHTVAVRRFPDVHGARRLHDGGGPTRLLVEARLLARQASADVARLTGVSPEVVDAYEALFFHCRDRLDARDWVLVQAIHREGGGPEEPRAALIRSFAYHGGPLVLDAVLPYLLGGRDSLEPVPDLSTPEGRREQALRLAVAVHLLPEDAMTRQKLHNIVLILRDRGRKHSARPAPAQPLPQDLACTLDELPAGGVSGRVDGGASPGAPHAGRRRNARMCSTGGGGGWLGNGAGNGVTSTALCAGKDGCGRCTTAPAPPARSPPTPRPPPGRA
jgi:hypothetical protein